MGRWIGSEPTRSNALYKRLQPGFFHFFSQRSLSSLLSSHDGGGYETLTLNCSISPQKFTNHGLIPSSYRSKHESVTENHMHHEIGVNLEIFPRLQTFVLPLCFFLKRSFALLHGFTSVWFRCES